MTEYFGEIHEVVDKLKVREEQGVKAEVSEQVQGDDADFAERQSF